MDDTRRSCIRPDHNPITFLAALSGRGEWSPISVLCRLGNLEELELELMLDLLLLVEVIEEAVGSVITVSETLIESSCWRAAWSFAAKAFAEGRGEYDDMPLLEPRSSL